MPFGATIALAMSLAFTGGSSQTPPTFPTASSVFGSQTVEQYTREYFADEPILAEIAKCESNFAQYGKDGQTVRNPGSSAIGLFQIMSSIHGTFADEKLGLDIYTLQGNAAYARYLFDREGTAPWNASKACWGKSVAYKNMQSDAAKVAVK